MSREISESEGLANLMQIYQDQLSMWITASIAMGIGLLVIPLLSLTTSLDPRLKYMFDSGQKLLWFTVTPRLLCCFLTFSLAVSAVYCVNKAIYLGAMLRQTLIRLRIIDKGKSLMQYNTEIKKELRRKYPVFGRYKMAAQFEEKKLKRSYSIQVWGSVFCAIGVAFILFLLVWWGADHFLRNWLITEAAYGLSVVCFFLVRAIIPIQ